MIGTVNRHFQGMGGTAGHLLLGMRGTGHHFPEMKETGLRFSEMTGIDHHFHEMNGKGLRFQEMSGIGLPLGEVIMISHFHQGADGVVGHHHQGMKGTDGLHSQEMIVIYQNGKEGEVHLADPCHHEAGMEEGDLHSMSTIEVDLNLHLPGTHWIILVVHGLPLGVTSWAGLHPHLRNLIALVVLLLHLHLMQSSLMIEEDLHGTGIEETGEDPLMMSGQENATILMTEGQDHPHPAGTIQITSPLDSLVTGKEIIGEVQMTDGLMNEVRLTEDPLMMTSTETDPLTLMIPTHGTLRLTHPTLRMLDPPVSLRE